MENQTVIEIKGPLRDTPNDTSPRQCCCGKKVLVILVKVVVMCGIMGFVGGTVYALRKLTHQKDAEGTRKVTQSYQTNEGGLVNALSIPRNQEDAGNIRNETQSPYTIDSSINKCLYITSEDFLTKLLSETFAYGECTIGSEFVKTTCGIGKEKSESSHACELCTDGSILPSFCFCDKKVHCVKDKELGSRAADDSKKTCNWCADVFDTQVKNRGNASCPSHSQDLLKSTCNEGYNGFMCSVITKRVCTLKFEQPYLLECNRSNLEECFLKTIWPGKYYYCQHFTDSNIKERSFLEACK